MMSNSVMYKILLYKYIYSNEKARISASFLCWIASAYFLSELRKLQTQ